MLTPWPVVTEAWHLLAVPQRLAMMRWVTAVAVEVAAFDIDASAKLVALLERIDPGREAIIVGRFGLGSPTQPADTDARLVSQASKPAGA